eukprot:12778343-Alexandrium_andersonii.AAC.1
MSASLVGSEMCIRDSLGGELASSAGVYRQSWRAAAGAAQGRGAASPAAVSYTHLTLPTICSV